jgi:large subunit ribosomal protein L35e
VHELRGKSKIDLQAQLKELKSELSLLRVTKVTGGAPNKLSKMCVLDGSLSILPLLSYWPCFELI